MKWFLIVGLIAVLLSASAYDLLRDGAMADVRFRVVDDLGEPVHDADMSLVFFTAPQKADVVKGKTNKSGFFVVKNRCMEELRVVVRKMGHYEVVRDSREYRKYGLDQVKRTHKWSEGTVDIPVVLKRKRHPIETVLHSVMFKPFPNTNEVVKLDLEMLEWCPPYGNGRHDDLHLVFDGWRNPADWDDYHEHLKAVFPNAADGFYRLKVEPSTAFPYAYAADTNRVYEKSFAFRHVHTKAGITESRRFADDEYLIYRVRTVTNELGEVTHAHYGRIGEKLGQYFGLSMKSWFNPTDNDPNLEDSRQF